VQAHAQTGDAGVEAGAVAHYPARKAFSSTQILALVREHAHLIDVVPGPLGAALARKRALARAADALSAVHFPVVEADADLGRRRLAFRRAAACPTGADASRGTRELARPRSRRRRELTARWLSEMLRSS